MGKKYYAIKKAKKTGIFTSWDICKQYVDGYSGAEYKSFTNRADAENYLKNNASKSENDSPIYTSESEAIAYVDGSYNNETSEFSYGAVIFFGGKEYHFSQKFSSSELSEMRNVAGEIKGSEKAMEFAVENKVTKLTIYYDYAGIAKWCTGEWQAKKQGTKEYKQFYEEIKESVHIDFIKVKSHSGNKYNEIADKLAKEALIEALETENKDIKASNRGIYIDRDSLEQIISETGRNEWSSFEFEKLSKVGNADRCIFYINGKKAILDFYFKNKGTVTITPTGSNRELSERLRCLIEEQCEYKDTGISKTHSLLITKEWALKLIDFLSSLNDVEKECNTCEQPKHESYKFKSNIGDKITFNIYDTGKLVIQGKPAYLYSEAMAFLSYCPEITVEDILEANNKFQDVDIKIKDVRDELKVLMPNAYGNIDDTIIKILSPSITLKKIKMDIEDYSCYAFPALRALEGYLKYLLGLKDITIGHDFGKVYSYNKKTGEYYLKKKIATEISDIKMQNALEQVYNYFNKNRHTIFHTDQILIVSRILEDNQEADLIINEVINMIESTYSDIMN